MVNLGQSIDILIGNITFEKIIKAIAFSFKAFKYSNKNRKSSKAWEFFDRPSCASCVIKLFPIYSLVFTISKTFNDQLTLFKVFPDQNWILFSIFLVNFLNFLENFRIQETSQIPQFSIRTILDGFLAFFIDEFERISLLFCLFSIEINKNFLRSTFFVCFDW